MPADSHPHSPTPEEIMAYLDGETPPESRPAIETHLAGCKECEMVADSFRRVSQRAAEWTVEPSPAAMGVPEGPLARPHRPRLLAWRPSRLVLAGLTAAAAVLLVILLNERPKLARNQVTAKAISEAPADALTTRRVPNVLAGRAGGDPIGRAAEIRSARELSQTSVANMDVGTPPPQTARTPAVIRTASLQIVAKDLGGVRAAV